MSHGSIPSSIGQAAKAGATIWKHTNNIPSPHSREILRVDDMRIATAAEDSAQTGI
jgi:hypothetical protein